MGIREDLLALADDMESTIGGCYGCLLDKRGLCKAETDFDCNDEVCKFVAHRLRAIAGKDAENVTTVSAYDLLPDEDRKAIAWVREQGGLDRVKKLLDWVVGHCSTKQQLDFDFWLSGRVMYELGFDEDMADRDEVERRLLARFMPEGMSWPVFEDGAPVSVEDEHETNTRGIERITGVEFLSEGCVRLHHGADWLASTQLAPGERVKRPAPKVVDADGVEIRVGDTVWDVESGIEYEVVGIHTDEDTPVRVMRTDGSHLAKAAKPSTLTHAKPEPDSWECLIYDAAKEPASYCCKYQLFYESDLTTAMMQDLVRRARKLAERSE